MTARRTATEQRRENRRDEILKAAQELFLRKGYSNTSLDDIARAVGIKREGLYYYFPNRPQILIEIIKPLGLQLRDRVREIQESDVPPDEKMRLTVENHLMRFEKRFAESQITLRDDYFSENEDVLAEMRPIWDDYERLWILIIEEGQPNYIEQAFGSLLYRNRGTTRAPRWAQRFSKALILPSGPRFTTTQRSPIYVVVKSPCSGISCSNAR